MDGEVGLKHLFQLAGIVVDLDDLLAGQQAGVPQVARAFVETGAEKNHQVGMVDDPAIGAAVGGDAEAAQRERRFLVDHALALERGGDRDAQLPQRILGAGEQAAVAGDDHRMPGGADHARHRFRCCGAVAAGLRVSR